MMDGTSRGFLVAFVVLLGAALGFSILTGGMMGPGMMGSGGTSGRGWAWGLGMGLAGLSMLAFWGALIVGIGLLFRALGGRRKEGHWRASPIDILKRRYAAGELSREQYEQMRQDVER
ncbi:MAG: SHOCT domain-containing protein [Longimicrobiales bacterium]